MTLKLESSIHSKTITPPGPHGLPFVGNLPFLGKYPHKTFIDLAKKYGDVYQIYMANQPVVVLNGLETIIQANLEQSSNFASRPSIVIFEQMADGLTISATKYGQLWKQHREITQNAMNIFLGARGRVEAQSIDAAIELAEVLIKQAGKAFNPIFETNVTSGSVAYELLFGDRKRSREDSDFLELVRTAGPYFVANTMISLITDLVPPLRVLYKRELDGTQYVIKLFRKLALKHTDEHEKTYDPNYIRDMTDALLRASNELSDSDNVMGLSKKRLIIAAIHETLAGGFDTIATGINWSWQYMIANPQLQAEIQEELDRVIGRERSVCWEDRENLPLVQACIHEILRHTSYFTLGLPHVTTVDTSINGYFIPKDTLVLMNLYGLSRDERFFPEPEKFNPRRFLNEHGELNNDLVNKFYPFGIGKRRCIAEHMSRLQLFLFFTNVLQKCKFEKVPEEQLSFDGIPGFVSHPKKYQVIVKPR